MNDFKHQVPILSDGWDCLSLRCNGQFVSIPDNVMLDELIRPPLPYKILPILRIYKTSENRLKDVIKIINDKQKQPSWKLINQALKGTNSKRLYVVSSQNAYRISPLMNLESQEANLESQRVLQHYSNIIINNLAIKINYLSKTDIQVREICDISGCYFETYQFHQAVQRYCSYILPHPYRTRLNRENSRHIHSINYRKKIEDANRIKERFSLYHHACDVEKIYVSEVNQDEKTSKEFDSRLNERIIDLGSVSRKIARLQRSNELPSLPPRRELHQCVFCYRFSFVELPPQGDDFKQHCDRNECIAAYERWLRHVNRLGIRLKREKIVD